MSEKVTSQKKWQISILSGLIFMLISAPYLYKLMTDVTGLNIANDGCPTMLGLFIHTVVFVLIVRLLMK